ncbi:MAG TPA: integrase arm-type DNA-binding domain-containing protein [Reyranella sp.]|nr:integrase arm-type DNA-binding domain-containing protein [Reyranella sp.]
MAVKALLTDTKVKNAKARVRPYKLGDGGWLYLLVKPSKSKLWRMAYRFHGREKLLALGSYPEVSLKDARNKRDEARSRLQQGFDPGEVRKLERLTRAKEAATTFRVVAEEYLARQGGRKRANATLTKNRWLLEQAYPHLGNRPIASIKAAEVLAVLKKVEARGRLETARRLRAIIGAVFRHAIATVRAEVDPTAALRGALQAPEVTHRPAITDPVALGGLLRAIDGFSGQPVTSAALRLLPLVFTRPGELRTARWSEISLDEAVWRIPATRTKMRREHMVPLPKQALAILRELQPVTGKGELLFPSIRSAHQPMSDNTLNAALRRLGYGKDEVTAHGFRATASTLLNESGRFSADAIERALAHQDPDPVRRAYARGSFWKERVEMAQWWADHLDTLRNGGSVVPLRRPA